MVRATNPLRRGGESRSGGVISGSQVRVLLRPPSTRFPSLRKMRRWEFIPDFLFNDRQSCDNTAPAVSTASEQFSPCLGDSLDSYVESARIVARGEQAASKGIGHVRGKLGHSSVTPKALGRLPLRALGRGCAGPQPGVWVYAQPLPLPGSVLAPPGPRHDRGVYRARRPCPRPLHGRGYYVGGVARSRPSVGRSGYQCTRELHQRGQDHSS